VSEPAPSAVKGIYDELKTFALGFVIAMAVVANFRVPQPAPVPPTPNPIPVPVPVPPGPTPPAPVPPDPTPPPAPVSNFFSLGRQYKQALGTAYADAWDREFQVRSGDDLDTKLVKVKEAWDASRAAAFSTAVTPEFDKIAPDRKPVDQPTADALNRARSEFARGLREAG